ncbi:GNAT family N-acetyltransferase [Aquimarina aquimarini]|uniref:GNAT family N-acetyltransferase n=1 Tax=Aquimarina aquimarini TaxID=1191734 RepID=UPI000D54C34B|nr:GNAT family N-acetyltransferase [Aquimarina aquimarini]
MIIRPAHTEDLPVLLHFEQKIIETERPMDPTLKKGKISYYDIESYITAKHTEVIVAEIDGKVIGSGYGQIRDRKDFFKQRQLGYIGFIYVEEAHRGKGISQQILQTLNNWFKTKGIEEIRLTVYEKNPRAIKAYEKAGFEKHFVEMRINLNE